MTVKVEEVFDGVLLMQLSEIFFNSVCFWGEFLDQKLTPLSIEIKSSQVASRWPMNDSIWVDHWDDEELIPFKKQLNFRGACHDMIDHSFTNKRTDSFTWMLSCCQKDSFLILWRLSPNPKSGDNIIRKSMS